MLSLVHDMAEADVGDITPEHASGVSKETKLALEQVKNKIHEILSYTSQLELIFFPPSLLTESDG